jgi:hypothetical protein
VAVSALHEMARKCRMARSQLSPTDRRKASTLPGSPQRCFLEGLAQAWHVSGRVVAVGPGTAFATWCRQVFDELDEQPPMRLILEVARAWSVTASPEKPGQV